MGLPSYITVAVCQWLSYLTLFLKSCYCSFPLILHFLLDSPFSCFCKNVLPSFTPKKEPLNQLANYS